MLIDAGGATLKSPSNDHLAFHVTGGARFCVLNAALDGQGTSRAVVALGADTTLQFMDVSFLNCSSIKGGGAVYMRDQVAMQTIRCRFNSNGALYGGAVWASGIGTTVQFTDTTFQNCSAEQGAAVYLSEHATLQALRSSFNYNVVKEVRMMLYRTAHIKGQNTLAALFYP